MFFDRRSHGQSAQPKSMKNGSCSATTLNGSAPSPLSSRPELRRSVVERSAVSADLLGNVLRPEKSWAVGPTQVDEHGSCSATTLNGSAPSPLSSRPELRRSVVERSAVADLSWECSSTGEVMG